MGAYLNPGNQSYRIAVNSEIFIDKSEMIQYLNTVLNTQQRFVSVSRPRRFGKTMAADMICAYYDREAESRELFVNRKLAGCEPYKSDTKEVFWDEYLGKFDVIRLVMTDFMEGSNTVQDMLQYLTDEVTEELLDDNPDMLSKNYEELIEYINKAQEDAECLFDLLSVNDDQKDIENIRLKKFIYIRDLYIIGILLKLISE